MIKECIVLSRRLLVSLCGVLAASVALCAPAAQARSNQDSVLNSSEHQVAASVTTPDAVGFDANDTTSPFDATLVVTTDPSTGASPLGAQPAPRPATGGLTPQITPSDYTHHFTTSSPSFSATDANGHFNARITYTSSWPLAWSFVLNQANTYVLFHNSLVTEDADQYVVATRQKTNYHDHHVEPVDYLYHSTVPVNNQGTALQLDMRFYWKWRTASASGTATLYATLNYTVYGPDGCPHAIGGNQILSVLPNC